MASFSLNKKLRGNGDDLYLEPRLYVGLLREYCLDLIENKPYQLLETYKQTKAMPKLPILSLTTKKFEENISRLANFYSSWQESSIGEFTVWSEKTFQKWGTQKYPKELKFKSIEDLFVAVEMESEFYTFLKKLESLTSYNEKLENLTKSCSQWFSGINIEEVQHLLSVVEWFKNNPTSGLYMRQVDVQGVHTKWIESNKTTIFSALKILNDEQTDKNFEEYTGLRKPPQTVRLRIFGSKLIEYFRGLTDLSVPINDLNIIGDSIKNYCRSIVILENETPGLYFDGIDEGICIFGMGNAVTSLCKVEFISKFDHIYYIGDLDVEGLYILNRLRKKIPQVSSICMDVQSFKKYKDSAVVYSPNISGESIDMLNDSEVHLFNYLIKQSDNNLESRLEHEYIKPYDLMLPYKS